MIYLVQNEEFLKIGYTENLEERLKEYNTHNPNFELIGYREGTKEFEKFLHKRFENLKTRNEWFRYSEELIKDFLTYTDENYNFPIAYACNHVKVYINNMKYNLKGRQYDLLYYLHSISRYNTGIVIFNIEARKRYLKLTNTTNTAITNTLKQLEDNNYIKREKDKVIILNIVTFWHGDQKVRLQLLKDPHRQKIFNYEII